MLVRFSWSCETPRPSVSLVYFSTRSDDKWWSTIFSFVSKYQELVFLICDLPKPSYRWYEASAFALSSSVKITTSGIGHVMRPRFVMDKLDDTFLIEPICENCDEHSPLSWICIWDILICMVYMATLWTMASGMLNMWRQHQLVMKEKRIRKQQRKAYNRKQKLAQKELEMQKALRAETLARFWAENKEAEEKLVEKKAAEKKAAEKEAAEKKAAEKEERIRGFLVLGICDAEDVHYSWNLKLTNEVPDC